MSKPLLLSMGKGKVQELAGTTDGQLPIWNATSSEAAFVSVSGDATLDETGAVTVTAVQGTPWSATSPTTGQVPTYNGSTVDWATISSGGGGSPGGTGLAYLLNYSVAASSPPAGTWETMSLTPTTGSAVNTGAVTAPNGGTWANLADFVTPVNEPGATTTPPGFWDVNVYLSGNGAPDDTQFRFVVGKLDGTTQTDLYTSTATSITDPQNATPQLYTASLFVPAIVLTATERITIKIQVSRVSSNAHTVTGYFEGVYYSHIHTTLGAPGGTGFVRVVDGIVQAPASLILPDGTTATTKAADNSSTSVATTAYVVGQGYLKSATATSTYLALAGGTLTGKLVTPALTTSAAGFNIAPTSATPTTLVNGDMWTTTTGLFARINGATQQYGALGIVNFWTSTNTFSASTVSFGTSGNTGTVSLGTGSTLSGSTKTVNIGTGGLAGSTTTITIGATDGTSTTALNGTVSATTAAVDTSTTQLATTAYVVGQGYAKLASPTFSGTPSLPTGTTGVTQTAGNNSTALATTAFVTAAVAAAGGSTPYDLSGEFVGTPVASAVIMRFVAVRAFTLAGTAQFACVTGPTSTATFTVNVNGASKGTVTIATSSTSGTGSITSTLLAAGDVVTVVATTPAAIVSPYWTLPGTV